MTLALKTCGYECRLWYLPPDVEFATTTNSVKLLWAWVKCARINAKNHPVCVICWNQARVVVGYHKITGVNSYISTQTGNLFKKISSQYCAKKVAISAFFLGKIKKWGSCWCNTFYKFQVCLPPSPVPTQWSPNGLFPAIHGSAVSVGGVSNPLMSL